MSGHGDEVTWLHTRRDSDDRGWAGDGKAVVVNFDPARAFFAGGLSGDPGPAVEIQLKHNGLRVWVSPGDLAESAVLVPAPEAA